VGYHGVDSAIADILDEMGLDVVVAASGGQGCQDLLGRSAGEVIRDRVLLEAKRLLTNAGMTATEIAYELNFQDNSYFNRFFKKYEGVTPDEFRRANRLG